MTGGSVAGKAHVVCPLGTPVTSTVLVLLPRALGRGVWVCFVLIETGYHVAKTDLRLAVWPPPECWVPGVCHRACFYAVLRAEPRDLMPALHALCQANYISSPREADTIQAYF